MLLVALILFAESNVREGQTHLVGIALEVLILLEGVVDLSEDTITLQIAGESRKIDSVHTVFSKYGVIEMVRSGKIIIARGTHSTS